MTDDSASMNIDRNTSSDRDTLIVEIAIGVSITILLMYLGVISSIAEFLADVVAGMTQR